MAIINLHELHKPVCGKCHKVIDKDGVVVVQGNGRQRPFHKKCLQPVDRKILVKPNLTPL